MNPILKKIITILILTIIPIAVGLPFAIVYNRYEIVEIMLVLMGCFELLAINIRSRRREKENLKKYQRYDSKKTDEGYEEYNNVKKILIISGLINLLASLIWFFIF